jgi:uncharacterized protein YdeI (YjbR/CyaY-like superfamily)
MADAYFDTQPDWQPELRALRQLLLAMGLTETIKWRQPCYTDRGKNIVILSARQIGCELSFLKGALLDDPHDLLILPGPDSRIARLMRFTAVEQIETRAATIRQYVQQAIELTRAGARVPPPAPAAELPVELVTAFEADPEFHDAFKALTPGRQRGYLLLFKSAKQASTRARRVQEMRPRILLGKGRHDCICGRSKRMPRCDGSHQRA